MNDFMWERTWAQVDLDAVRQNFRTIRGALPADVKLCCVVKANAYGHGASKLAPLYEQMGADWFAVSNIEEALQLRRCGVTRPVLILGYTPVTCAALLCKERFSQCVYSAEYGRLLSQQAVAAGVSVPIHIKLDTGMGRLGFQVPGAGEDSVAGAAAVCRLPGLVPEGVFTHFASADEGAAGDDFSNRQVDLYVAALNQLKAQGITFAIRHCANSAALSDHPECRLDMVRAGIVLYGLQPSGDLRQPLPLTPAMSLRSVVSHVKTVAPGTTVSYGRTFVAQREMRIATVPIGYADGFWRKNSPNGVTLTLRGQRAPILGRVCMDQLMLDVTHIPDVTIGDEVTVFGTAPAVTAEELASANGTIGYEVVCGIGERVPRVYVENGQTVDLLDNLMR
ncbi:MAG: alanine racemase [Ruminococcaceae bacterium]|nr:alanine racemase [Oscillospiraceae bacterium]